MPSYQDHVTMLINAAWESRDNGKHICRWCIVWDESSNGIISGSVGGYSGGGCFELEMFHAKIDANGDLASLWIDYIDHVSGDEIDFQSLEPAVLQTCANAEDLLLELNDKDAWYDSDQLVIQPRVISKLTANEDMLYYSTGSLTQASTICKKLGLTASPAATQES